MSNEWDHDLVLALLDEHIALEEAKKATGCKPPLLSIRDKDYDHEQANQTDAS